MHVLVTCKYEKDRVKSNREKVESEILCMSSLPASIKRIGSKQSRKGGDIVFPIISQWGFLLPCKPEILSHLPKPYAAFPPSSDATHKIWSRLANWLQRYSSLKVWTMDDDGRTTDHWYTWWNCSTHCTRQGTLATAKRKSYRVCALCFCAK